MDISKLRTDLEIAEKVEEMVVEVIEYLDEEDDQDVLERLLDKIRTKIWCSLKQKESIILSGYKDRG